MENYGTARDIELWQSAAGGDPEAEEELLSRYAYLVRICSRPLFLAGGDSEDLMQEGMLGLLSAVRHYSADYSTSFKTYAEHCVRNRLYSAVRSAAKQSNRPLNDAVSIEDGQSSTGLRELEDLVITREYIDTVIRGELSPLERRVLERYLDGLSYAEIAESVGIGEKSVDNAVQRIRKKLSSH